VAAAGELGGVADEVEKHVNEPVGVSDHLKWVARGRVLYFAPTSHQKRG